MYTATTARINAGLSDQCSSGSPLQIYNIIKCN